MSEKPQEFIDGFEEAERRFYESDNPDFDNPFKVDTEQHRGFEEAVYIFTQK